jgi:hypothetical protein
MKRAFVILLLSCAVSFAQPTAIPYTTTASGQQIPIPSWVSILNGNFSFTPAISGTPISGDCVKWVTTATIGDAGAACGGSGGGGNVSSSGSPTQYQTAVWASGSLILGINTGTTGMAFVSGGGSAYPSFSASLSGVTSVNGTTIPASATLAQVSGSGTSGHCAQFSASSTVTDAGAACSGGTQFATITTNTTLTASNCTVLVNAAGGNITVTLPTAIGATYACYVKRIDNSANTVSVNTTASQAIDGQASQGILFQYTSMSVKSDGSNWWIF